MKKTTIELKLPVNYTKHDLLMLLKKKGHKDIKNLEIIRKSLDARKRNNIVWNLKVEINGIDISFTRRSELALDLQHSDRETHVVIVGSGPGGIFSGLVLLRAGFKVTLLEKGSKVEDRNIQIDELITNGIFNENSNFAFGEGGAGTYSDGKLTSRNKHISKEKDFILSTFINNGAPEEIYSMVHPHVGSDNLKIVAKNIRGEFLDLGGEIFFDTEFITFNSSLGKIKSVETSNGVIDCNYLLLATGHSSIPTYRELIKKGVIFNSKNFAIGFRAEHPQTLINNSQWGQEKIKGLKAAEYRLTAKTDSATVFSFCMCPGGTIVPSAAMPLTSVVNGMSNYNRDSEFANAAVVAGFNFQTEHNREVPPLEALDMLTELEQRYFNATKGYVIPSMKISDFLSGNLTGSVDKTSYPLGVTDYDLKELLPKSIIEPLKQGLTEFSKKLRGYETGNIMGLESKTSSPIQVLREKSGLCHNFDNLYFVGEGSGWAGGIISSAADGIKGALDIIKRES
ncbi:MAG: FAD-dependent monooxygenase [Spirochaetaceae bacterium]